MGGESTSHPTQKCGRISSALLGIVNTSFVLEDSEPISNSMPILRGFVFSNRNGTGFCGYEAMLMVRLPV